MGCLLTFCNLKNKQTRNHTSHTSKITQKIAVFPTSNEGGALSTLFQNVKRTHVKSNFAVCSVNFNPFLNAYLYPPSKKGEYIALLLSVCRSVGPPTAYVHFLCRVCIYYEFIIISILDPIEPFSTEVCPLDVGNVQLFAVSVLFLCRACTY